MKDGYIIGIDTSCYTTSIAACSFEGDIFFDGRTLLKVKEGERGLRQSDALFQHMQNLPRLVEGLMTAATGRKVSAVAVSDRPRPVSGSYMPVFTAGLNFGTVMAQMGGLPLLCFSHQEGHIEAARQDRVLPERFLAFHLSGGTTELLEVRNDGVGYAIDIIGGSRDLSAGQLIDRVGVALGLPFPCGKVMDDIAVQVAKTGRDKEMPVARHLPDIHIKDTWMNLSGIETRCQRLIQEVKNAGGDTFLTEDLTWQVFSKLQAAIGRTVQKAQQNTGIQDVLMIGGVSESRFMRFEEQSGEGLAARYGTDNACGTAKLGLRQHLAGL